MLQSTYKLFRLGGVTLKKFTIILLFLISFLFTTNVQAAETFYSVDETVHGMNKAITNHDVRLDFEAYIDVSHENFGNFFQNVLFKQINEQYTHEQFSIQKVNVSYLCMNGKCDGYFTFTYYAPQEDYLSYKQFIQQLAAQHQHLSYDEKISFVNQYLIDHTEYSNLSKPSPHSPVAIQLEGRGVCQAYSIFAYDLLNALGVPNYLLDGAANGEAHLWNVLKDKNGNIVHLDTTWNDTSRTNNYYLISTNQISQTHHFDSNALQIITHKLNNSPTIPLPDPNEEELKPDFTHHAMYVYAKEFLETKASLQHLTDLGTLTNDSAFEIKFNKDVTNAQDFKSKVFITDSKGAVVDVQPVIDGRFVRVYQKKAGSFKAGEQYYLVILKGIESEQSRDTYLKESVYVTFTIQ